MGEESRRLLIRGAKPRCDIPRGAKLGASGKCLDQAALVTFTVS